ncbi:hypothetical protein DFH09DRAFT_77230 [Mycena vulgaris]|nr:hypothetical protein DFH09DRAFT_77230 [Mycena vulgaris]
MECYSPTRLSLQLFACSRTNIPLGLVFYNELYDISLFWDSLYWDSLTPVGRAISKHIFLLEYLDATAFPVLDTILWKGGRSSHGIFPLASPPTSRLLTLVNPEGRLRMSIVPDGDHQTHYSHVLHTESVTRDTISWIESEFRKPSTSHTQMAQAMLKSLALAVYRIVMVASGGASIVSQFEEPTFLGELVVHRSDRAFWPSRVQLRHYLPVSPPKSYKWTWYDNTKTDIYHGIPGWTRFTLRPKSWSSSTAVTIVLGDEGYNVDNWDVLLSCLTNWAGLDADLRAFCLERCTSNTQAGFVTKIDFTTYVREGFAPLPGYNAADIVYLFIEDLRVEADGYIPPCRRYHSLDRTGSTPMSAGLQTLYGVDQDVHWAVRKDVSFFNREQYAVLDELWSRFGDVLSGGALGNLSGVWRNARPTLKRSHSATRIDEVDWRTDWMWEDHRRDQEKRYKKRRLRMLKAARKRRPELILPFEEPEEQEVPEQKRDLVCRLHRSKTKSVGGGLSLIFSHVGF